MKLVLDVARAATLAGAATLATFFSTGGVFATSVLGVRSLGGFCVGGLGSLGGLRSFGSRGAVGSLGGNVALFTTGECEAASAKNGQGGHDVLEICHLYLSLLILCSSPDSSSKCLCGITEPEPPGRVGRMSITLPLRSD
jgi:hypothetical protein